jgi:signal transduction histidine kinase
MEYRANLLGGQLKVHAQPKRGVRVTCYFPTTLLKDQKLTKP